MILVTVPPEFFVFKLVLSVILSTAERLSGSPMGLKYLVMFEVTFPGFTFVSLLYFIFLTILQGFEFWGGGGLSLAKRGFTEGGVVILLEGFGNIFSVVIWIFMFSA